MSKLLLNDNEINAVISLKYLYDKLVNTYIKQPDFNTPGHKKYIMAISEGRNQFIKDNFDAKVLNNIEFKELKKKQYTFTSDRIKEQKEFMDKFERSLVLSGVLKEAKEAVDQAIFRKFYQMQLYNEYTVPAEEFYESELTFNTDIKFKIR